MLIMCPHSVVNVDVQRKTKKLYMVIVYFILKKFNNSVKSSG